MELSNEIMLFVLLFAIVVALAWIIKLEIRISRILGGKNSKDFENVIRTVHSEIKNTDIWKKDMEKYLESVEHRLRKSIQTVNTVRFNPFKSSSIGGNQSFAIALLDENKNGVVISSLFSRDRTNVFAKPIVNLESEYELTEEEKDAIKQAGKIEK